MIALVPLYCMMLMQVIVYYRLLPAEDEKLGFNYFCQEKAESELDKSICQYNRFTRFQMVYVDGMPYYLAKALLEKEFMNETISFSIDNPGLKDSGPVYRTLQTGKLNYFYTGILDKIDNLWLQMKKAGIFLVGTGVGYPIRTMTNDQVFSDTIMTPNGFSWLNPEYKTTELKKINSEQEGFNIGPAAQAREEIIKKTGDFMEYSYKLINPEKSKNVLDYEIYSKNRSFFTYTGETDEIGHIYSLRGPQTQFSYGQQLANIKSFYKDYLQKYNKTDLLFVLISDHGTYERTIETEVTNHGYEDKENRGFAFLMNPSFGKKDIYKDREIHISQFASYLSLFIRNSSIPILSTGDVLPRYKTEAIEKLIAFRSQEVSLNKLLYGSYDKAILSNEKSPFYMLEQTKDQDFFSTGKNLIKLEKTIEKYETHLKSLQAKVPGFYVQINTSDLTKIGVLCLPYLIISIWVFYKIFGQSKARVSKSAKNNEESTPHQQRLEKKRLSALSDSPVEQFRFLFIKAYRFQVFTMFIYFGLILWAFPFPDKLFFQYLIQYTIGTIVFLAWMLSKKQKALHLNIIHCKRVFMLPILMLFLNLNLLVVHKILSYEQDLFLDPTNFYLNIFTMIVGVLTLSKYFYHFTQEAQKEPFFRNEINKFYLSVIACIFIWHIFNLCLYEYELTMHLDKLSDPNTQNIASEYFKAIFGLIVMSMGFSIIPANCLRFLTLLSILLWFSNPYFRIVIFVFIVPIFEFIMKHSKNIETSIKQNGYEKKFISTVFYFQAFILYFIHYGSTDTNVNVRAANRTPKGNIGVHYVISFLIYWITKYSIQIVVIGFLNFRVIVQDINQNIVGKELGQVLQYSSKTFLAIFLNLTVWGCFLMIFELVMSFNYDAKLRACIFVIPFYGIGIFFTYFVMVMFGVQYLLSKVLNCTYLLENRDKVLVDNGGCDNENCEEDGEVEMTGVDDDDDDVMRKTSFNSV